MDREEERKIDKAPRRIPTKLVVKRKIFGKN